jgi:predicted nucleic acid-binding protein
VELSSEIAFLASGLLLTHVLRAADAIQLASCIHVARHLETPAAMVVYDAVLAEAARNEGVRILGDR